ncbi:MAG: ATP-binding cassette domain-containing protein [Streptosporangiales bacterium]|nr:ATP-binding cassette domain-containing protein [Streptosporangiales bacterium]
MPTETLPDAELRDIRKEFPGGVVAVDGVDLTVGRGEFFSLLGPSGCGKTTLLRILAGLERPSAGTVLIRGVAMERVPPHRRPTNLVFQRLALFPHLTVAKNIAFGPSLRRGGRRDVAAKVTEMLKLVDLAGYGDRYPDQLSGGQQQRVAIARALANEPALLLLDEPLSSLDLNLRIQMQAALKRIQQDSGTTFVYVTHDQGEAFAMSDRIAVMNAGRVEQVGPPRELYRSPRTRFTATFLGDTNLFEGPDVGETLESGGITVTLPTPGRIASVRPEHVAIAEELRDGYDNRFTGVVGDVVFQGSVVRYTIQLDAGPRISSELSADAAFHPTPGQRVEAGWQSHVTAVLDA